MLKVTTSDSNRTETVVVHRQERTLDFVLITCYVFCVVSATRQSCPHWKPQNKLDFFLLVNAPQFSTNKL